MHHGTPEQSTLVKEAIEKGGLDQIDKVTEAIHSCGALEYTQKIAEQEQQKALEALSFLDATPYKEGLEIIARFSIERKF